MKKILSAALVLAMVFTMALNSFAKPASGFSTGGILGVKTYHDSPDYICRPKGSISYDDDYYIMDYHPAEYGATVFLELTHAGGDWENFSLDMIRNISVKADWEEGGELVESIDVTVVRSISWNIYHTEYGYYPALVIKLKDSTATTEADVLGTVTLNKRQGDQEYRIKDEEIDVEFAVNYWDNYINMPEECLVDGDRQFLIAGTPCLLKFSADCDDEVDLEFGSDPNEGTFTVDVSGQGKLLLLFDTVPNAAVEAANPNAHLTFFGFNGAQFNRTGEFFYETESGRYIYELVNGIPVLIAGAEYDESDEGFRFNTRRLGRYVISDIELVSPNPEAAAAAERTGTDLHDPVDHADLWA